MARKALPISLLRPLYTSASLVQIIKMVKEDDKKKGLEYK